MRRLPEGGFGIAKWIRSMSEKLQGAITARQHTVLIAIQAGEIEKRGRRDGRFLFGVGCGRPVRSCCEQ